MAKKAEPVALPKFPTLSSSGSDAAPIIFFDSSSAYGYNEGVVMISVEAVRMISGAPDDKPIIDRVVVAHLRTTVSGAITLRDALNNALLMATLPEVAQRGTSM